MNEKLIIDKTDEAIMWLNRFKYHFENKKNDKHYIDDALFHLTASKRRILEIKRIIINKF